MISGGPRCVEEEKPMVVDLKADEKVQELAHKYAWISAAEVVAIPLPFVDLAAVFASWGHMVKEIGALYGYELSTEDGGRLAGDILKGALLSACAWVGSGALAGTLLKLIPGAGPVAAYLVDAAVAGVGVHKVTAGVATAAALYFKTGRSFAPKSFTDSVKKVLIDPELILSVLATVAISRPGV
jgi:uncharacterized protein (DUF697 family)